MEFNEFSWETFSHTGNIDAYLLYKSVINSKKAKDKEEEWQPSTPSASL